MFIFSLVGHGKSVSNNDQIRLMNFTVNRIDLTEKRNKKITETAQVFELFELVSLLSKQFHDFKAYILLLHVFYLRVALTRQRVRATHLPTLLSKPQVTNHLVTWSLQNWTVNTIKTIFVPLYPFSLRVESGAI